MQHRQHRYVMIRNGAQAGVRLCSKSSSAHHKGGQRQQQMWELNAALAPPRPITGVTSPLEAHLYKLRGVQGHNGGRNPNYRLLRNKQHVKAHSTQPHYWQSRGRVSGGMELQELGVDTMNTYFIQKIKILLIKTVLWNIMVPKF